MASRIGVRLRPIISMMVGSDTIEPGARMGYFAYTVVRETFEMRVPGSDSDARAGFEGRAGTSSGAVPHKEGTHVQAGPAPPLKAPRSRRITFSGFLRHVALLLNDRANDLDAVFPSFGRFTPPQAASAGIDSREMVQFHHPLLGADLDRLLPSVASSHLSEYPTLQASHAGIPGRAHRGHSCLRCRSCRLVR